MHLHYISPILGQEAPWQLFIKGQLQSHCVLTLRFHRLVGLSLSVGGERGGGGEEGGRGGGGVASVFQNLVKFA